MSEEITKIYYLSRAEAEPLEDYKRDFEALVEQDEFEQAQREVREALYRRLNETPEPHKSMLMLHLDEWTKK